MSEYVKGTMRKVAIIRMGQPDVVSLLRLKKMPFKKWFGINGKRTIINDYFDKYLEPPKGLYEKIHFSFPALNMDIYCMVMIDGKVFTEPTEEAIERLENNTLRILNSKP